MFENPRREAVKQEIYNKCSENSRSQIVSRTDIFRKLTWGAPGLRECKSIEFLRELRKTGFCEGGGK